MIKRKILLIGAVMLMLLLTAGCGGTAQPGNTETLPSATHMADASSVDEVCALLKDAGLENTDVFREWVVDFSETAGKKAHLAGDWLPPEELAPDTAACADGWESRYDYSDADCRMTAFLLLGDSLQVDRPEKTYTGTYLMFDLDAIDRTKKYASLKARRNQFFTLFGDKSPLTGALEEHFPALWKQHGIRLQNDRVSLISIVLYDPYDKTLFVGHTGILVDCGDSLLFVEKIAFEQPYQATKFRSAEELLQMLSRRQEYFGEDGESGPFVYQNDRYLGTLQKSDPQ